MNKRVLITGAAGRIGGLLLERLPALGWDVSGCDRLPANGVTSADICNAVDMRGAMRGCDSVIHLAGTPNANPGWDTVNRLNIHGTRTVLEAARNEGLAQVIYASSIHTIGGLPADTPFAPDLPAVPSGIYGLSKTASEGLLQVYAAKTELRCISLRICSFRPEPSNRRELRTWLGYDDTVHLADRCLADETPGYQMIWGVSANERLRKVDPTAERIGYRPTQNAEDFSIARGGHIDGDAPEEWGFMGGPVADDRVSDFRD